MVDVDVGSVWVEDYDFGTGLVRRVRVLAINGKRATIRTLADNSDNEFRPGSRVSTCKLERFGKSGGYLPAPCIQKAGS
jgi:hypothetical protein